MSIAHKTIIGSATILMIKLIERSLGIISLLILARLLSPEDFGVVAIATSVVFLCDVLSESGANQYLIQKQEVDDKDINTAWSLGILFKSCLALILAFLSPFIASFFNLTALTNVLYVMAVMLPLSALANPSLSMSARQLDFKPFFKVSLWQKISSFIASVSLAYALQSYWAMIISIVVYYMARLISSYCLLPYRPKFDLSRLAVQWQFSKWVWPQATVGFAKSEFDTFFVSKMFSIDIVGGFNVMRNLSMLPAREIIQPLCEPLLSSLSATKDDSLNFADNFVKALLVLLSLIVPLVAFVFVYSEDLVRLFLGVQWVAYSPLFAFMIFFAISFSVNSICEQAMISVEKVRALFYLDLISLTLLICFFIFFFSGDIFYLTLYRVLFAWFSMLMSIALVYFIIKFSFMYLLINLLPVLFGSLISIWFSQLWGLNSEFNLLNIFVAGILFSCLYLCSTFVFMQILSIFPYSKRYNTWLISLMKQSLKLNYSEKT